MNFRLSLSVHVLVFLLMGASQAQTERSIRADGSEIVYYLDLPQENSYPIIAVLQGSECLRVADKYTSFVEALNSRGVAVLRVEKPGLTAETPIGECPPEYLEKNTWDRRVLDILAVVAEIRRQPRGWNGQLGLAGGSEGAMVAAMTAPLLPEADAVLLFSSGGALEFREEVKLSIAQQMRAGGAPETAIEQRLATIESEWADAIANPNSRQEWGSDGKLARNTFLWWANALPNAVHRPLLQVDGPIRVYQGSQDSSSLPELGQGLADLFRQQGRSNLELVFYNGEHVPPVEVISGGLNWLADQLSWGAP